MRQAYDYWQDQPGTYHRRRARTPAGPRPPGCGPQRALARPPRPGLTSGPLALRQQARGLSPVQVASDARARLPTPRRSAPRAGPGTELPMLGGPSGCSLASPRPAPPSASARSWRLQTPGRVSPRLGGACLRPGRGPSCPCGVAPAGARSPAPGLRRPQPRPGPGGFRRPGASPRASEERASGRAWGRAAHAGWPPRALARQPPACAVLAWPDRVPATFWFTRSERRRLHASSRGVPLGTVRLRTATWTKACDPSATACALPLGRPPPWKDTSRLRGGHLSPHASGPSRRVGAPAPGYRRPTDGRRPGLGCVGVRSWRPGRRQRPCHRALCVLTRRGCPILYVPAQCAPAKTEALLPSRFREGGETSSPPILGEASSSSPPVFGRGGASGAQAGGPRPRPGSRLGVAHLRTGGEEECTGTADTNPGCNYLVRGYSLSMHYFWRGDMPHFSSSLPFQRGCGGPPTPADGAPSTSAGQSMAVAVAGRGGPPTPAAGAVVRALHFGRDGTPGPLRAADTLADGGPARRSPSAAGRDRRNLKLARRTGRGPAAASATSPSPAALPHFHTTFDSAHNAILR